MATSSASCASTRLEPDDSGGVAENSLPDNLNEASTSMPNLSAAVVIPDSLLAKEATEILREHSTELL